MGKDSEGAKALIDPDHLKANKSIANKAVAGGVYVANPPPQAASKKPSCLRGIAGKTSPQHLNALVNEGLPSASIEKLEHAYRVTRKEIATALRIPMTTLSRRMVDGRLNTDESDRVVRFARLKDLALKMMQGDDEQAIAWLRTPAPILGNESPFVHATTEVGAREVEMLIGRIRHGVFS